MLQQDFITIETTREPHICKSYIYGCAYLNPVQGGPLLFTQGHPAKMLSTLYFTLVFQKEAIALIIIKFFLYAEDSRGHSIFNRDKFYVLQLENRIQTPKPKHKKLLVKGGFWSGDHGKAKVLNCSNYSAMLYWNS